MLLSHKTSLKISQEYSNIIGHMCYAASKLWNVCNYERHHYKELGLEKYPDWYYQKK
ncbi:transposase, partial [Blautia obeum]|nr:transposase [Blautia obeum]